MHFTTQKEGGEKEVGFFTWRKWYLHPTWGNAILSDDTEEVCRGDACFLQYLREKKVL
ncbi:uncharacterized protein ARB_06996 [Trichophyton benhamiae CBS 112371]|uniref:Uncharacterized protein n=1 Tax=Arthroderma benhamiae (strain ATCC MYA-4681 / CBS 112371) TaxID=663331 RepID=D4ARY1_ARTBC|nr:uncharacterized protein ARB_06996 [Trichophyton benhamiae CBS 112371]EFE34045.1 hypothetical protein ARB_06996 [Trichophyton benhamiae CBS 112371]